MSVSVCLSLCVFVRDYIFRTTRPIFTDFFVRVTYRRGSILLWRCSDTLCTSGFMDEVIFAQSKVARHRRPGEAQCTRSLGLGYKLCAVIPVAGQRTNGTTFLTLIVTSLLATRGGGWSLQSMTALFPMFRTANSPNRPMR